MLKAFIYSLTKTRSTNQSICLSHHSQHPPYLNIWTCPCDIGNGFILWHICLWESSCSIHTFPWVSSHGCCRKQHSMVHGVVVWTSTAAPITRTILKKGHGTGLLTVSFLLSATKRFGVQTQAYVLSSILLVEMLFDGDSEETCYSKFEMHFLQIICNTDLKLPCLQTSLPVNWFVRLFMETQQKKGSELSRKEWIKNWKKICGSFLRTC